VTTVYSVIGEHRDDPARLLALGSDGQPYALALSSGAAFPVEPDDAWRLDAVQPDTEGVLLEPPTPRGTKSRADRLPRAAAGG
jgi:hypothetical protein